MGGQGRDQQKWSYTQSLATIVCESQSADAVYLIDRSIVSKRMEEIIILYKLCNALSLSPHICT